MIALKMDMIINSTDFIYQSTLFLRDTRNGRCYRMGESSGRCANTAAGYFMVRRRISLAQYNECLAACRRSVSGGDKKRPVSINGGRTVVRPLLRYPPGEGPCYGGSRRLV
jgi:hypothetical protein